MEATNQSQLFNILSRRIESLKDVVEWGLCTGCGACHYFCDKQAVELVNIPTVGIRPRFASPGCGECTKCLPICPGYSVDARRPAEPAATVEGSGAEEFGPSLELWEGYACDSKVRF